MIGIDGAKLISDYANQSDNKSMPAILEIQNVTKRFGAVLAVRDCSFNLESGLITGLIGPNGAGKSTLFNIVAGVHTPDSGEVRLNGLNITGLPAHELFARGLLRTFQIPHEFSNMTALENLLMVPAAQRGENLSTALFFRSRFLPQEKELLHKALTVIDFLGLGHVRNELAGNLSGGQKKLLELGRTLMVDAKVVLLDEIGAGVNRTLLNTLSDHIEKLNRELAKTFFIIEHNMEFISRLCHRVTVMVEGEIVTEGEPEQVINDPRVVDAYFGGGKRT